METVPQFNFDDPTAQFSYVCNMMLLRSTSSVPELTGTPLRNYQKPQEYSVVTRVI